MPGLLLPQPLDPSKYVLQLTPGTYSDLYQETVGSAGDPGDEMDLSLGDLAGAFSDWLADFPNLDADVAALAAASSLDTSGADSLAAGIPNADAQVQTAKLAFQTGTGQIINANPNPTQNTTPVVGQPDPVPYWSSPPATAGTYTSGYGGIDLNVMALGEAQQIWKGFIGTSFYQIGGKLPNQIYLLTGDPDVFSVSGVIVQQGQFTAFEAYIYANAVKVGRFPFTIQVNYPTESESYLLWGGVTILAQ